jgi:hypothetical protein
MRAPSSGQSTFVFRDVIQVGSVAERARVHELILSHYLPATRDTITDAEWEQRAGQRFSGKTTAGSDGPRRALPRVREEGIEVT